MISVRPLLFVVLPLLLSACGAPEPPPPPMPVKDTVYGDAVGAMDKARGIEATTMEQKKALDRAVQEAEGR
jgi:hypothetical protein